MPISPISKSMPTFSAALSFEECLNPQVRINKIVNKHTVDYHPSPSELTSRIHFLTFLWTPKGCISPEYFLKFFSKLYDPPFLLMPSSKNLSQVLIMTPRQNEITHFPRIAFFENLFPPAGRREDYGAEKITKIKLARVLVISFDKFHHFNNLYLFFILFYCVIF